VSSIKKSIQVSTNTAGNNAAAKDTTKNKTNKLINPNDLLGDNADFSTDEGNQPQQTTTRVNTRKKAEQATTISSKDKLNKFYNESQKKLKDFDSDIQSKIASAQASNGFGRNNQAFPPPGGGATPKMPSIGGGAGARSGASSQNANQLAELKKQLQENNKKSQEKIEGLEKELEEARKNNQQTINNVNDSTENNPENQNNNTTEEATTEPTTTEEPAEAEEPAAEEPAVEETAEAAEEEAAAAEAEEAEPAAE
jgi:hypothetical protein